MTAEVRSHAIRLHDAVAERAVVRLPVLKEDGPAVASARRLRCDFSREIDDAAARSRAFEHLEPSPPRLALGTYVGVSRTHYHFRPAHVEHFHVVARPRQLQHHPLLRPTHFVLVLPHPEALHDRLVLTGPGHQHDDVELARRFDEVRRRPRRGLRPARDGNLDIVRRQPRPSVHAERFRERDRSAHPILASLARPCSR